MRKFIIIFSTLIPALLASNFSFAGNTYTVSAQPQSGCSVSTQYLDEATGKLTKASIRVSGDNYAVVDWVPDPDLPVAMGILYFNRTSSTVTDNKITNLTIAFGDMGLLFGNSGTGGGLVLEPASQLGKVEGQERCIFWGTTQGDAQYDIATDTFSGTGELIISKDAVCNLKMHLAGDAVTSVSAKINTSQTFKCIVSSGIVVGSTPIEATLTIPTIKF